MDQGITVPVKAGSSVDLQAPPKRASWDSALTLTYQDLLNKFLEGATEATQRLHIWAVRIWVDGVMALPESVVGDELLRNFEEELTFARNRLTKTRASRTAANFATTIRSFRALYLRELQGGLLPDKFSDVIQLGLKRLGKSSHSLRETFPESVYHWAVGNTTPKRNGSLAVVHQLEDYLELPHNSLAVRAHRKPVKVQDLSKDVPWRRYVSFVRKFKFRLKPEQMPAELRAAIDALIVHKGKADHLLPDGRIESLRSRETWNSPATIEIRTDSLYAFFGFLVLPKATKPEALMSWEEKMGYGLGLPLMTLRLTMLLNREYLFAYLLYCQMRTYDKAAFEYEDALKRGKPAGVRPAQKTLPVSFGGFTVFVNNLVNKPHSFFCLHPQFAGEVGVAPDQWATWLEQRHQEILSFATTVRKKVVHGKRSNKELLQEMLRAENPLDFVHQLLTQMRKETPPETAPMWVACHYRDIALFSILLFDPLRLKNLSGLLIGKHIREDGTGRLVLEIDKSEFKNHIFGHAESRYRELPAEVAADVRKWLKCRVVLPGHEQTDLLFMAVQKKSAGKGEPFVLTRNSVYNIFKKHTQAYLGLNFGTHAFRTLLTTAVARFGTPAQVKAIVNDSEEVAMSIYRDVRNVDEFKALDNLHERLRAASQGARN